MDVAEVMRMLGKQSRIVMVVAMRDSIGAKLRDSRRWYFVYSGVCPSLLSMASITMQSLGAAAAALTLQ